MVNSFRDEIGMDTLWFITGELYPTNENKAVFNDVVIRHVSDYIPYSDYVVSEGTVLMSDNAHFDEPSVQLMGERYAEKILHHVYPKNQTTALDTTPQKSGIVKVLQDGQIYILRNNQIMTLLGQTIYNP